jgi:hypothetical protein
MALMPQAAVRTAIKELLQGSIGAVRVCSDELFRYGAHEGKPISGQQAKAIALDRFASFDVKVGSFVNHSSTPSSITAGYRTVKAMVDISFWVPTKTTVQDAERDQMLEDVERYMDVAIQALSYPHNLDTTSGGASTNIVSGLLFGPDGKGPPTWELLNIDWANSLHRSVIHASAIVQVDQATA